MTRKVTASELAEIMRSRSQEITRRMGVDMIAVMLGIPTDGEGLRIVAHVEKGYGGRIPSSIIVDIDGEKVSITIEAVEDYEPMVPLSAGAG